MNSNTESKGKIIPFVSSKHRKIDYGTESPDNWMIKEELERDLCQEKKDDAKIMVMKLGHKKI